MRARAHTPKSGGRTSSPALTPTRGDWWPPRAACSPRRPKARLRHGTPRRRWPCWPIAASRPRTPITGRSPTRLPAASSPRRIPIAPNPRLRPMARIPEMPRPPSPDPRPRNVRHHPHAPRHPRGPRTREAPTWSPYPRRRWTTCGRARCAGCSKTGLPDPALAARPRTSDRSSTPWRRRPPRRNSICRGTIPRRATRRTSRRSRNG